VNAARNYFVTFAISASFFFVRDKMGGDDIDDDFLIENVVGSPLSDDDEDDELQEILERPDAASGRKRKLSDADRTLETTKSSDKNPPGKVLIEAGKYLNEQSIENQSQFLETLLRHHALRSKNDAGNTADMENVSQYLSKSDKSSLVDRIKDSVSMKKLKKWKTVRSPSIVVICVSARRAVSVLKELSPLKARAAKLFPKNGDMKSQLEQLSSAPFGVAVGTPHRLHVLCEQGSKGLSFEYTQLIVVDCHMTNKDFTVCTLPDTAPDFATLLQEFVLPSLQKRKDMRLAFF
jgi:hypothetical protein